MMCVKTYTLHYIQQTNLANFKELLLDTLESLEYFLVSNVFLTTNLFTIPPGLHTDVQIS
jgi:hypothetical protein